MCGGGAKSPKIVKEKMDSGLRRQQERDLREFKRESKKANKALRLQIEEQNRDSLARTATAQKEAKVMEARAARLAKTQIKGSYRTTALRSGAPRGSAAGVKVTRRITERRPQQPLQLMTGDTFQT